MPIGICGVCSGLIESPGGVQCNLHHLQTCAGCVDVYSKAGHTIFCPTCSREEAKGSADPKLRPVGHYPARVAVEHQRNTKEMEVLTFNYTTMDDSSHPLARLIASMGPYQVCCVNCYDR